MANKYAIGEPCLVMLTLFKNMFFLKNLFLCVFWTQKTQAMKQNSAYFQDLLALVFERSLSV